MSENARKPRQFVLHLGAHRTGTTLLQEYMYRRAPRAKTHGIILTSLSETRTSLLDGIVYGQTGDRVSAVLKLSRRLQTELASGSRIFISDENLIGTMERNSATCAMYADVKGQISRLGSALDFVDTFYVSIRRPSEWWASCLMFLIERGHAFPSERRLKKIAESRQSWLHLIKSILDAFPGKDVIVREFDYQTGNPKRQFREVTGWRDLQDFPNVRKRANQSIGVADLHAKLIESGQAELAVRLEHGFGLGFFEVDQIRALDEPYIDELFEIRSAIAGRGRLLTDETVKAKFAMKGRPR